MRTIEHTIGGTRRGSAETLPVYDPATGEVAARVSAGTAAEVDDAVAAAGKAFEGWSEVSLARRSAVMFAMRDLVERHADDLARLVTAEHGKTLDDARAEVARGREVIDFACGIPSLLKGAYTDQASTGVDAYTFRQPLGVCAGITPFNFPVMVPMWMHPLAIACGNTFVLKPSERDPSASDLVASLYAEAGLPDGVFNVVHGDKVAVDALLDHDDVAAVSFVGSTPVARYVHQRASAAGKRVQALGGAKNHAVVLPDADLDDAARQITGAAYGSAGQRCMAISAVVAVGAAADGLVTRLAAQARAITVGAGSDPASEMGPVVTAASRDRVASYVDAGEAAGATLVVDGRDLLDRPGFFVGPCLFDNVATDMTIYQDEIFGPVLVVLRVSTLDEAISLLNANPYGNGAAIFTDSGTAARRFQRAVRAGMVGVNVPVPVPMAYHSFGGWKASLFGDTHVHGPEGVAFYTRAKAITSRWPGPATDAAPSLHFPTAS
ncbi:malonate-semialdehyde dehydrogenase (acetylating)/methylmalonate-semialdehyde dehydrogenase [Asanoa ferruginea]|uniref:methylmalonate-semialdehyde dehydrogenase (CoA acylating) n=1 Tax=Asanoa ferruginea TaxID=53367 RepID=A0A3D9ZRA2_9ACTN|nr:CoA-acylating methylmalonate-semialdehyde dehydrogenase [Asanoa ferruginea]REF99928.1 malonate-semialdehyde dehydrogenase (acetylating)/methylmalonate-semialdehyde dehydrogenase [Asanoa ferruginea]GIF51609.1 methylmalonate-semialdehyde dehydrogenase (acylating) [Asanoa ferruginea]